MLKDILKKHGVEDQVIENIFTDMAEGKVYITKEQNIEERYSKVKNQKNELDKQLADRDKQIEELMKNNSSNTELLNQLEALKQENLNSKNEYESKISKLEFNYALDKALLGAKCRNTTALKALLRLDDIKMNEGKLEGLEEQLETLRENDSYLFEEVPGVNTGSVGNFGSTASSTNSGSDFMTAIKNNSLRQ